MAPLNGRAESPTAWLHLTAAMYGFGWALALDVGVRIYSAEIVGVVGLGILRWGFLVREFPDLRRVLAAYGLWVLAIVLSDVVNATATFNMLRDLSTPIVGALALVFVLSILSRAPSALVTMLIAMAIGKGVFGEPAYGEVFGDKVLSWEEIQLDTDFFKVRVDPFLTPATLVMGCWVGRRGALLASLLFLAAGAAYFFVDARSSGLVFLLSAIWLGVRELGLIRRRAHLFVAAILAAVLLYGAFVAYTAYTLRYNADGHHGKQLQLIENPYNPLSILVTGRSEWAVMPLAIAERPLSGWGSWAEDKDGQYAFMRLLLTNQLDDSDSQSEAGVLYIPSHSLIGAAWVWSGLLGLVAVLWLLKVLMTLTWRLASAQSHLIPAIIFMLVFCYWHYFFSPPMVVRLYYPMALGALIAVAGRREDAGYLPRCNGVAGQ